MSSYEKTRKQIQKKRHGNIEALHEFSRDSRRLHRASVRDQKIDKLVSSRGRREQPMCSSSPSSAAAGVCLALVARRSHLKILRFSPGESHPWHGVLDSLAYFGACGQWTALRISRKRSMS